MRRNLRFICSFILVWTLYGVPYCFKKELFLAKSRYFYYLVNYNICTVYTHEIQRDLHNMKGIRALISRRTCTTSQVLVSGYSLYASISVSHVKASSEQTTFIWATAAEFATVEGSVNPRKPMCEDTRSSWLTGEITLSVICCQDRNVSGTLHAPQLAKQGRK